MTPVHAEVVKNIRSAMENKKMNRELITSKIIDLLSGRLESLKESLKETEDSEK